MPINFFDTMRIAIHIPFIVGAIFLIFFIFVRKRTAKQLDTLKNFLNGRVEANFLNVKFIGDYKGSPFEIKQIPGGKNSPPKIQIKMRTLRPISVKIYKHSFIFSLGEKLGILSKSISTGDMLFDKIFRISSSSDMNVISFISSAENRTLIQDIFRAEFKSFKIKSGHIEIMKPYNNLENELKQDKIIPALKALHKLAFA